MNNLRTVNEAKTDGAAMLLPARIGLWQALAHSRAALPASLALALFLSLFLNLHSVPLLDVDEGAFSEATREMLASGDYVTTYLNGNLRFDKPILTYWLQAISVSLFGISEFAFRLPSALASVGWIAAIMVFVRQQTDRATGYAAALIGTTTVGIAVIGRAAIADALLNLFLVLAMFDIYRYLESKERKYRYRTFLWMALGMLTKGPIALLIPFAASGLFFVMRGKFRLWLQAALDPLGWLILLAVAGPWYGLEYQQQGQAFIEGFFLRHNVGRFNSPMQGHGGGLFYYLPAILLLLLPYSGLFIRILPTLKGLRRNPLAGYLWTWFLFVFVFFSFSGTKLPHYLIYGATPLFILMAMHRDTLRSRWLVLVPPILFMCLVLALPMLLKIGGERSSNLYTREMLSQQHVFGPGYYLAGLMLLGATLALAFTIHIKVWKRLIASGFLSTVALSGLALPAVVELQQSPVKEAAAVAKQIGEPVRRWQIHMPSFSVYLSDITKPYQRSDADAIVFTRVDRMDALGPADVLFRRGGIVLVRPSR